MPEEQPIASAEDLSGSGAAGQTQDRDAGRANGDTPLETGAQDTSKPDKSKDYDSLEKKLGEQGKELGELRKINEAFQVLIKDPDFQEWREAKKSGLAPKSQPAPEEDEDWIPTTKSDLEKVVDERVRKTIYQDPAWQDVQEMRVDKEYSRLEAKGYTDIRAKHQAMSDLYQRMGQTAGLNIEDLYFQVKGSETLASQEAAVKTQAALDQKKNLTTPITGRSAKKTEKTVRSIRDAALKAADTLGMNR